MEAYDIFIAGGDIGRSAVPRFAAQGGLKPLFVEKCKTPRTKPCCGIQFPYFEKILGAKIPAEHLRNKQITRTKMYCHDGSSIGAPFRALIYMRKTVDNWLNILARERGGEFQYEYEER
jgi:flavin-dependent dehydrogenase